MKQGGPSGAGWPRFCLRLGAALLLAEGLFVATPAHAETRTVPDRVGDVRHGMDIRGMRIHNGPRRLVVVLRHREISERAGAWAGIYIDVTPRTPGPDYLLSGGAGTHWDLLWTSGWRAGGILGCSQRYRMSFNYRLDRTRFVLPRTCLNGASFRATKVRVAARAGTGRAPRDDWAPARHLLSRWVAKG